MLILSRKEGERIVIGRDVVITVVESRGNRVRLGITAPRETPVNREEVLERLARGEHRNSGDDCREEVCSFVESN